MAKALTTEQFKEKYKKLNMPVEIIGEYINCKTKIKCKCLICNDFFEITPDCLMSGQIHKPCAMKKFGKEKTKTHNEFSNEILNKNSNLVFLSKYVGSKFDIKLKCTICNKEFSKKASRLLINSDCPYCAKRGYVIDKTQIHQLVSNWTNNNITLLGEYKNMRTHTTFHCNVCNNDFTTTPTQVRDSIYGACPKCSREKSDEKRKSSQSYIENWIKSLNENLTCISDYTGYHNELTCQCDICGNIMSKTCNSWNVNPYCSACDSESNMSFGEKLISKFLSNNHIEYETQKTFDDLNGIRGGCNNKLRYDFFIPQDNLLIEFQGMQHYRPSGYFKMMGHKEDENEEFKYRQYLDLLKKEYALNHKYNFLEISYKDIKKVDEILNNYFAQRRRSQIVK